MSRPSPKKCYVPSIPIKIHINSVLLCTFQALARGLDLAMTFSRTEAGALKLLQVNLGEKNRQQPLP